MRKGLGVLLVIGLTMAAFVNPGLVPQKNQASAVPVQILAQTSASHESQSSQIPLSSICRIEEDPFCSKCTPAQACPSRDMLETIESFFGSQREDEQFTRLTDECRSAGKQAPASFSPTVSQRIWGIPNQIGKTLRFILATAPDPAHTHLSLFFDRQIEAIQEAAQEDGYNFARAWMPWETKDHLDSSDPRIRMLQSDYSHNREKMPGLMIFRKTAPKNLCEAIAPLFVLVVGETPTGGINKNQFAMALRIIKDVREGSGATKRPLYIMGPTFAGSLYSLMFLLREIPENWFSESLIHSGTASSWKTVDWFQKTYTSLSQPRINFRSFQESDCYAIAQMIGLLKTEGYGGKEVTLLSEDESAYGEESCGESSEVVQIHFPREISALRAAYQHDLRDAEASTNTPKPPVRSTLRSNLEDSGSDDDSVPPFSRLQTPLSEEAVLMGIVSNLQEHHSQFVIIRATNPLDSLFVGQYLRKAYPGGRIITLGADLRFQREMEDPRLRGILALTPYSLLPGVDDHRAIPADPRQELHTHRVFPSSLSVGTYNAMLSLLRCDTSDPQSATQPAQGESSVGTGQSLNNKLPCADLPVAPYSGYGWPILAKNGLAKTDDPRALVAPVWLTALGRNGYWPVALLKDWTPVQSDASIPITKGFSPPPLLKPLNAQPIWGKDELHAPLAWKTIFWLGIAMAMGFLFQMWKGSLLATSDTSAKFAPFSVSKLVFFVTDLLLLLMLLALSWPWVLWGLNFAPAIWSVCIVFAIIAVIWVGFKDLRRRGAGILGLCFLVISIIACILSCLLARSGSALTQNFMMYRLIHVSSGVSPLVPLFLLLAAGLWWSWYTLVGLALLDDRRPRLPRIEDLRLKQDSEQNFSRTQAALNQISREENDEVTRLMRPNSWDVRLYAPPIIFLLLAGTAVEVWHPVQSLEGQSYDIVYGWLLGFIIFILILGLCRLSIVWLELRKLLTSLDQFPMRRSFERLEGFTWKPIWRLGGGALEDSYRLIWRQFDSLDHLWNEGIYGDDDLKEAVQKVRTQRNQFAAELQELIMESKRQKEAKKKEPKIVQQLRELFQPQPSWVKKWIEDLEELQKQLATTCGAALKYLSRVWAQEKEVDMFEVSRKDSDKQRVKRPKEANSTQLAEQFVCLSYLNFILDVIFRMRTLVMSAAGIYVFALFSFSSYPFEPRSSFHILMILLFLLVVIVVAVVLAQMHRNSTLSRITNTVPGELGIDFWFRLVAFLAVPLLSLVAAQFPEIQSALFSWMEPFQALK